MSRRHLGRVAVVSALLGTLGSVLVGCGGDPERAVPSSSTVRSTSSSTATAVTPPATPATRAHRVGAFVPQRPRWVLLPNADRVPIESVGSRANGVLDVPEDIRTAGWWRGGSKLGDPFGSTLVAAHVDSVSQGLGPFSSLLSVRPGDRLRVGSRTLLQEFRVRSLSLRPRGAIAGRDPMFSPLGHRRLTLVTCAGPYDPSRGGYQNLAVIVAYPISAPIHPPHPRHHRRAP